MLKAAGLAAGAVVGAGLLSASDASAADGAALTLGTANTATSNTSLTTSGTIANDGALSVTAAAADYGVYASAASYGLVGSGPGGVLGLGTVGGVFSGSVVAINLDPQTSAGAPSGQAFKGDMAVDSAGVLWLCVAAGTPGTWIRVSHGGTRPIAPQRAYDSRQQFGGPGQFTNGETRSISIAGVVPGVPANAVGLACNITVTSTADAGFLSVYPTGQARPTASTINWSTSGLTIANGSIVGAGTGGAISVYAECTTSPATEVIVDVTAYVL